jgi:glutaredoxin
MDGCPHCVDFMPKWDTIKKMNEDQNLGIKVEEYERGDIPEELSQKYNITGFPSIIINGEHYKGERKAQKLIDIALGKQSGGSQQKNDEYYKHKYLKYKTKYYQLKNHM